MFLYIAPWQKGVEMDKILVSDSKDFEYLAENVIKYHSFAPPSRNIDISTYSEFRATGFLPSAYPDLTWMPGYPVFLASVYKVFGVKPFIGIFIQILISLFSVIMVYKLSNMFFQKRNIAVLAALLFSIDIHSAYLANSLLPDSLFVTVFLTGIYFFFKGVHENKFVHIAISAFLLGADCLIKPIILAYPAVLMFLLFFFYQKNLAQKFKAAMVFGIIYLLIIGIWPYRNHNLYGHWGISVQAGHTFLMYNVAMTEAKLTHKNTDSVKAQLQQISDSNGFRTAENPFDKEAIYKKVMYAYISGHKWPFIITNAEGATNLFLSLGNNGMANTFGWTNKVPSGGLAEISTQRIWMNFSANKRQALLGLAILLVLIIQYIGAFYGMIRLFLSRNFVFLMLAVCTILYWAVLISAVGMYRYKLALAPFICIMAAYAYDYLASRRKTNKKTNL